MSGCDFLPAIYTMPFNRMFAVTVKSVGDPDFFTSSVTFEREREGGEKQWTADVDGAVKSLAAGYFHLHRRSFDKFYTSMGAFFRSDVIGGGVTKFVIVIRFVL